jgi:predicted ATPase
LSADQFSGGVWLVELAPLGSGEAVAATVAATLGVPLEPGSTMTESIVGWLRGRPALLILDNCEHVLDHGRCARCRHRHRLDPLDEREVVDHLAHFLHRAEAPP